MATNYHEKLAKIIVDEILIARDYDEFRASADQLDDLGNALEFAEGQSRLESDLRKFADSNPHYYTEENIDLIMQTLSAKLNGQIHFRTLSLFYAINNRLVQALQETEDFWQIAKIIYSLGTLYTDDRDLKSVIYSIKDINQRHYATIVARVYFKGYEEVFNIFNPDLEI